VISDRSSAFAKATADKSVIGVQSGRCFDPPFLVAERHFDMYVVRMPELSRFLGIVIGLFPREHPPAHFHAVYGEYQITVEILTGIVHGDFPKRALRLVLEWLDLHQKELLEDWELVQAGKQPNKIAPLE
jgi:hypothetical protein